MTPSYNDLNDPEPVKETMGMLLFVIGCRVCCILIALFAGHAVGEF